MERKEKGSPSTGSRRADEGADVGGEQPVDGAQDRLCGGKNRKAQVARAGKRKLFDAKAKAIFLEWFAATCNVCLSAAKAGVAYQTVFKHRMKDEAFAEAWDRCLAQGYARVEAKMLETKAKPIDVEGDLDAPELEELDPMLGLQLLREHKRSLPGSATPFGRPRKAGRAPRVATNDEVRKALVKRLVAFGIRVAKEEGGSEA